MSLYAYDRLHGEEQRGRVPARGRGAEGARASCDDTEPRRTSRVHSLWPGKGKEHRDTVAPAPPAAAAHALGRDHAQSKEELVSGALGIEARSSCGRTT
jgi:hypothetical protein